MLWDKKALRLREFPRVFHHYFAFKALPYFLEVDQEQFFLRFVSDDKQAYLQEILAYTKNKCRFIDTHSFDEHEVTVHPCKISGCPVVLFVMPSPVAFDEAVYSVAVLTPKRGPVDLHYRYLLSTLSEGPSDQVMCELVELLETGLLETELLETKVQETRLDKKEVLNNEHLSIFLERLKYYI
jgi:hypothetical protein